MAVQLKEPLAAENVGRWYEEVQRSSAADFAAHHPELFFLLYQPSIEFSFDSSDVETSFLRLAEAARAGQCDIAVIPVEKSQRSPGQDNRIFVGRSSKCDIVIRHSTVSKLHAYISVSETGSYTLTDADSNNGTYAGDRLLAVHTPEPLCPNDVIIFGTVPVRVLDAESLHEALLRLTHSIIG
jgi:hypothetical protein